MKHLNQAVTDLRHDSAARSERLGFNFVLIALGFLLFVLGISIAFADQTTCQRIGDRIYCTTIPTWQPPDMSRPQGEPQVPAPVVNTYCYTIGNQLYCDSH